MLKIKIISLYNLPWNVANHRTNENFTLMWRRMTIILPLGVSKYYLYYYVNQKEWNYAIEGIHKVMERTAKCQALFKNKTKILQ